MASYCLYQDFPFRVRFREETGFRRPRRNEQKPIRVYLSEHLAKVAATHAARYLKDQDRILITTRENIVERMKYDFE